MSLLLYNLLGKSPKGFGLEIEDRSVKAFIMEIKNGRRCRFVTCGLRSFKKGIVQNGIVLDPAALAMEVKELLKATKPKSIRNKFVVISVPETKAFIRTINIPKMTRAEAEEAVKWETEANIPVSAEKVYLDWQVVDEANPNSNEVLVTAVPKEVVEGYSEAMRQAGLEILAVEIDIIATIRSLTSSSDIANQPVLIVDLGEDKTSLAVAKNQVPYFTSSLPLSGRTFTDALQKGLGVSFEKAEELKVKYGLGKMEPDNLQYAIFKPLVENLISEIEKSIRFYEESINKGQKIKKIILSGGGALLRDLSGYLVERLKREVALGNPLELLENRKDCPENIQKSLAPYATAIGLAARACGYNDQNKSAC